MKIILTLFAFLVSSSCFAQTKSDVKFGKISADDFKTKIYSIDSNANAIVIAEIGSTEIVGNTKGWFSLQHKHFRRVHILNKNGYDEATVSIYLYTDGREEEKLENLKAVTYNLQDGKVVETKLDKDNVFKDKLSKNLVNKKFTFPAIREGSIIEYEYTTSSDFLFNLQPWAFQGASPVLWSEYTVRLPEFLGYVFLAQGYQPYFINERKDNRDHFNIRDTRGTGASEDYSFDAGVTDYRWVMKNVPALKEESYTSTLANHIAKIEFQESDLRYPLTPQNIIGTWPKLCERLLDDDDFGATLDKNNGWLADAVKPLVANAKTDLEKAKNIFAYVRDNSTCTAHSGRSLDQSLKNVLKTRNGNVAEINLLLVAMLKYAGLATDPVILSTRSHGYTYSLYPMLDRFNYVVAKFDADGKTYFLDASEPRLGFGKLTPACYNGHARVVNRDATPLEFSSDSLMERDFTSVIIAPDEKGGFSGILEKEPGYYESHEIREKVKEKGNEEYFKEIQKGYGQELEIMKPKIDSLNDLEESVHIRYDFKMNQDKSDILYINPMFSEAFKDNPFKSAERFYPVEMPYGISQTYIFSMQVPDGYAVDELPKSTRVKLNEEGDGEFVYVISESGGMISLRTSVNLKRAFYLPEEYEMLREFFNLVVKKQNEQIVLKKKK
jgi:hypothetical protein